MSEEKINSYRDLQTWQEGMTLAEVCYRVTRSLPKEELFGLTSQIRRSAASVPANVAEGHGREQSGSFIQHLRVAQGSLKELETHLILGERVGLLATSDAGPALAQCDRVGKMLRSLIRSLQRRDKVRCP